MPRVFSVFELFVLNSCNIHMNGDQVLVREILTLDYLQYVENTVNTALMRNNYSPKQTTVCKCIKQFIFAMETFMVGQQII